MNKNERKAQKLRELREVNAHAGTSDAARGPFAIASAEIVLDLVLSGWFDAREDNGKLLAKDTTGAWEEYCSLQALRRTLLAHACEIETLERPRGHLRGSIASWRATGIRTKKGESETHYHCLFCDDDLATLGHGSVGRIAMPLLRKMRNHSTVCAMRFLMESVLGIYPHDPKAEPQQKGASL